MSWPCLHVCNFMDGWDNTRIKDAFIHSYIVVRQSFNCQFIIRLSVSVDSSASRSKWECNLLYCRENKTRMCVWITMWRHHIVIHCICRVCVDLRINCDVNGLSRAVTGCSSALTAGTCFWAQPDHSQHLHYDNWSCNTTSTHTSTHPETSCSILFSGTVNQPFPTFQPNVIFSVHSDSTAHISGR